MSQNPYDAPNTEAGAIPAVAEVPHGWVPPPEGEFLGHPKALWMLFSTEFWERFCYYGMRAILAIYVAETFFKLLPEADAKSEASLTYGGYTSLVYATGILGGFIADRYLGYQRSIFVGGLLMAIGMFMLLVEDLTFFLVGLSVIVAGNGLFKPNISSMVGKLYAPGDKRRDAGFTIFYMGINAGAFFAPIVCATWIGATFGYKYGFLAAGIGMILGLIVFQFMTGMLGEVGKPPAGKTDYTPIAVVIVGALAMVPVIYFLLSQSSILGYVLMGLMGLLCVYFVTSGIRSGDTVQRDRYIAMLILFFANILFWALFEQAGSSLNFFARDFVSSPFRFELFQSFNALFIILLAPVFASLWPLLDRKNVDPSIPRKFAIALISVGLGFLVLVLAIQGVGETGKVIWLVLALTYLIHTVAELCLSPIGLSMVTKLATPKEVGLAMGGWFLSTAMANYFAGVIASIASGGGGGGHGEEAASSIGQYATVFSQLWWLGLIIGGIFFFAAPWINRLMHGVK
ncbi:MAG: peptide MFS transporter [Pirellula sp.]|jgi:POT family proton-dependent oligopeptide transporter|nr:peptide MFS transporter [Pirellula sp.]